MTSVVIPGLDLVPSLPSRVVTVDLVDMTEGEQVAGAKIDFFLPGDLHVPADGKIVQATRQTLTLDANGSGRIRLPAYTDSVNNGDWVIGVKKEWAPHPYFIRVPQGSTNISLSAIPAVQEVPSSLLHWIITGASVTITQGAQWAAELNLMGGILQLELIVPPGGEAWLKGAATADYTLSTLPDGITQVRSGTVANALGLPVARTGTLEKHPINDIVKVITLKTNDINASAPLEIWAIGTNQHGVWQEWQQVFPHPPSILKRGSVANAVIPVEELPDGDYWIQSGNLALALGLPTLSTVGRAGLLEIRYNPANEHKTLRWTTNDVNSSSSLEVWGRSTNHQAQWVRPWHQVYPAVGGTPGPAPIISGSTSPRSRLLLDDLYARHGGPINTDGAAPVALTFDDYPRDYRDRVRPLLIARGLPATLGLGSKQYDPASTRIYPGAQGTTWEEIDTWTETEVANHGATHNTFGDDYEDLYEEIVQGYYDLQAALPGHVITSWMQPAAGYGDFSNGNSLDAWADTTAGRLILETHAIASGTRRINGQLEVPRHGKPAQGLARYWFDTPTGLTNAKAAMLAAKGNGTGLILGSHPDRYGMADRITLAEFEDFLDWLVTQQNAGLIKVMTLSQWAIADQRLLGG